MKSRFKILGGMLLVLLLSGITACGGQGGSSSAGTVSVTGKLNSASATSPGQNLAMAQALSSDVATSGITVIATNERGNTTTTTTNDVGSFTLDLEPGHTYVISFFLQQTYLGTLVFNISSSGEFTTTAFRLNPGDGAIGLGNIACAAGSCVGDLNPLCQLDRDDDGTVDCEDADDDNDGTEDMDEEDADHDGIEDDLEENEDAEDDDDDAAVASCKVTRMEPNAGEKGVDLSEKIKVRFSHKLDESTVTADSFYLSNAAGKVSTTLKIENEDDHGEIRLIPDSKLDPLTEYSVHVDDSIQCSNGLGLEVDIDINFTTENED